MKANKVKFSHQHETHKRTLIKFIALTAVLVAYYLYVSWKFDASTGIGVTILSWSFFVLCTPIADGGFIIAFPVRLLFGIKMSITQAVTWFIALGINIYALLATAHTYELTFLTRLLKRILTEPYPYWSILILSALGTFLSIYFGDEMMDVTMHKHRVKFEQHHFKYKIILSIGFTVLIILTYYHLISSLKIEIPE